ncbi:MAG: GGDEF domain-containing protein [Raoultibacter sp.]|jgi:diguanylate cyclase (GGDEF)-like protein
MKRIGSFFYRNFFDKKLSFEYRLTSIFFIEAFLLSMLSFTVNTLLGATNIGVFIQGFINFCMLVVFFIPVSAKQKVLPPLLLFLIFIYLPFLFFLYAGYDGSVLYFAAIGIFLLSFLYKGKKRIALISLNVLIYVAAILLQSNFPHLVVPMAMPDARVTDLLAAIAFTLFGMAALALYVNKAYEDERLRNAYLMNELEEKNVELEEQSSKDGLTGIFNRRYLTEASEQIFIRAQHENKHVCCIMFDIDHFKKPNDTFGHLEGDKVLIRVVEEAQKQLRKRDILARYGGEEFMIVLYPETLENAIAIAERIRLAVSTISLPDGSPVTISLGVLEASAKMGVDEAFRLTDEYLYKAKNSGRNRVEHPALS